MQFVPNQCAGARMAIAWHGHGHGMAWPLHGRQRRRDSGFTWAAGCMLHDVRCWLRVAWFVCVCVRVCYAVGLGRRSRVGWLPSGCTRRPRAGAVARCMSAWHSHGCRAAGRPCAGRRRAGAAPSRRGDPERPRVSCSTEKHAPCKQTPCSRHHASRHRAACNGCPRPSHVQGA